MIPNSMLPGERVRCIDRLLAHASELDGVAIEIGVFQCGMLDRIAKSLPHKQVYGFDTFSGLPDSVNREGEYHAPGEFSFSLEEAQRYIKARECHNVTLVKGVFPDSAKHFTELVCFAHLDVDFGSCTWDSLLWASRNMVKGGFIVIDDYGTDHCPNVKAAVDRFAKESGYVLNTPVPGQAWLKAK